ncbi:Hypothetical protein, putative [Bodo saltans]|uniref:Uncharacterized protein n=1 Tax=Bodo saltans TaxID=75058 RepID=A0A0S4JS27_BODSA|nr:Hypothetical protein, putative [Bodo saltans]|eukprot:CUG91325.1 Hypothetical protein, putative [Bodo saltans]
MMQRRPNASGPVYGTAFSREDNARLRQHVSRGTGEWSAVPECVRDAIAELLVRGPTTTTTVAASSPAARSSSHQQLGSSSSTKRKSVVKTTTITSNSTRVPAAASRSSTRLHNSAAAVPSRYYSSAPTISEGTALVGDAHPQFHPIFPSPSTDVTPLLHLSDDALLMTVRSFEDAEALRQHAVRNSALFHNNIEQLFRDMRQCLVPELRAAVQLHPLALSELKRQNASTAGARYGAVPDGAADLPHHVKGRIEFEDRLLTDVVDCMHKLRAASVRFTANFFTDEEKVGLGIDPYVLPKEDERHAAATLSSRHSMSTTSMEPLDRHTLLVDSAFRRNNGEHFDEYYHTSRHHQQQQPAATNPRWNRNRDDNDTPPPSANQSYDASLPSLYPEEGDALVPEGAELPEDRSPRRMGRGGQNDDGDAYQRYDHNEVEYQEDDDHDETLAEEAEMPGDRSPRRQRELHEHVESDGGELFPRYYHDHHQQPRGGGADNYHRLNPLEAPHYEDPFDPPRYPDEDGRPQQNERNGVSSSSGRTRGLVNFLNRSAEDDTEEPSLGGRAAAVSSRGGNAMRAALHDDSVTPSRVLNMNAAMDAQQQQRGRHGGGQQPQQYHHNLSNNGGDSMYPPPPPLSTSPMDRRRYLPPTSPTMAPAQPSDPREVGEMGGGAAPHASSPTMIDLSPRSYGRSPSPEERSNTPFAVRLPSTPRTRNDYVIHPSPRPISVKKKTMLVPKGSDRSSSVGGAGGASPPRSPSNSMRRTSAHQRRNSNISSLDASLSASAEVSPRHRSGGNGASVSFAAPHDQSITTSTTMQSPSVENTSTASPPPQVSSQITFLGRGEGRVSAAATGRGGVHW